MGERWTSKDPTGAPDTFDIPFLSSEYITASGTTGSAPTKERKTEAPGNSTRSTPAVSRAGGNQQQQSDIMLESDSNIDTPSWLS